MRRKYEKPEIYLEEFIIEDLTNDGSLSVVDPENDPDIGIEIGDILDGINQFFS